MTNELSGFEIVCLSYGGWYSHWGTEQQIMSRLSRKNRVLYVNRSFSLSSFLTSCSEVPFYKRLRDNLYRFDKVSQNCVVANSFNLLPMHSIAIMNVLERMYMRIWLIYIIRKLQISNPILWTFRPDSSWFIDAFRHCLSIYHCLDEWSAFGNRLYPAKIIKAKEENLLSKVDIAITTSKYLQEKKKQFQRNTYFIPNAADFELFSQARSPDLMVPNELSKMPKPIIGYVGTFHPDLLDLDLLEYLIRKLPYTFVFIGRKLIRRFDISRLEKHSNTYFLGFKEPSQLPGYLKGIDVCIMPSRKSELIDAVFPLKLFEYLAAGKPVVATWTKELSCFDDVITLVKRKEEFVQAIQHNIHNTGEEKQRARVALAKRNSWDARIIEIGKLINGFLGKGRDGHTVQV